MHVLSVGWGGARARACKVRFLRVCIGLLLFWTVCALLAHMMHVRVYVRAHTFFELYASVGVCCWCFGRVENQQCAQGCGSKGPPRCRCACVLGWRARACLRTHPNVSVRVCWDGRRPRTCAHLPVRVGVRMLAGVMCKRAQVLACVYACAQTRTSVSADCQVFEATLGILSLLKALCGTPVL